jgi:hypothetical protein
LAVSAFRQNRLEPAEGETCEDELQNQDLDTVSNVQKQRHWIDESGPKQEEMP